MLEILKDKKRSKPEPLFQIQLDQENASDRLSRATNKLSPLAA